MTILIICGAHVARHHDEHGAAHPAAPAICLNLTAATTEMTVTIRALGVQEPIAVPVHAVLLGAVTLQDHFVAPLLDQQRRLQQCYRQHQHLLERGNDPVLLRFPDA